MKLTIISDTHLYQGKLTTQIKEARPDVLVHCGDMTDSGSREELGLVAEWFGMLKRKEYVGEVVLIAGNHDRALQTTGAEGLFLKHNLYYLEDSEVTLHGFKFYGSPWTHNLKDWGFQYSHEQGPGPAIWNQIPDDTDILVTHSPPQGIRAFDERDWGCPHLLARVKTVKPRAHLFGHVHGKYGITHTQDTLFVNASSWTGQQRVMNAPTTLEFE